MRVAAMNQSASKRPHRVAMLAYPDAQILDITGPLEVFSRSSRWLSDHAMTPAPASYLIELVAAQAGPVVTSGGLVLQATRAYPDLTEVDTLLVTGGIGYRTAMHDRQLLDWLRWQSTRVQRLGSICTGALILGAAGLLDGKAATTHWAYCDRLLRQVPTARIEPDALYVQSGGIYTSAGVTAGLDMALALVEEDWGKAVALAVAQELVMFYWRPGGQSQFSRLLQAQQSDDELGRLELWILEHLDGSLSVGQLAERAQMSPRHFARRFRQRFGVTPAVYVQRARVEHARKRIEDGMFRLKRIARQSGFTNEQALIRAFRKTLGVTPFEYRQRFVG